MKAILINTPQGQYVLPAHYVAEHKARYFADVDQYTLKSQVYKDEVSRYMSYPEDLIIWLITETDWSEWVNVAEKTSNDILVTDKEFWSNLNDFKIINI